MSSASSITVPARRPLGLIAIVLIVDVGLAAAGGVLLSKGLASKNANKSEGKSEVAPVEKRSEAPTPPPAPVEQVAVAAPPAASSPPSTPRAEPVAAARESRTEPPRDKAAAKAKPPTQTQAKKPAADPIAMNKRPPEPGAPKEPQDPYQTPNTEQEIDKAAAKSKAAFDRCAISHIGHGSIKVAFQVQGDGRVINAAAVENTTANAELARCLVAEISTWKVSAHSGASISLLRPFTYP
jgi:hypothetical protein